MKRKRDSIQGGNGVQWNRGELIGEDKSGSVYLAELKKSKAKYGYFPQSMAVKSAEVSLSGSIKKEWEVLQIIERSRYIITCFGEEVTKGDNGEMVYNLLFEYCSGGTLANLIKKSNGSGLPEHDVRYHARSILRGISHIHNSGYVHCNIKPENIFLESDLYTAGPNIRLKIGDFRLAKRMTKNCKRKPDVYWGGTPLYVSPAAVLDGIQEAPDIWAFGCVVLEMLTGQLARVPLDDVDLDIILDRIGKPDEVSRDGREFLKCCFSRNPMYRSTAEMLLNHKFLEGLVDDEIYTDEIYTDENGLSYVVYEMDQGRYCFSLSDNDGSFIEDREIYCFDMDGIWSDEEVVDLTRKGSAYDDRVHTEKGVSTIFSVQNPVDHSIVQAGV